MTTYKILIIEDDEIVSRTIKRSLRSEDYHVTTASSGVEGLKTARANLPDLVILDVIMPGMDGYTVCREMRSDIKLSAVPILVLTAKIKDEDKIEGFNAGADDYLCKPINVCDGNEIQQFWAYFVFRETCPSKVVRNVALTVIDSLFTYLRTCPPLLWRTSPSSRASLSTHDARVIQHSQRRPLNLK